jgi:hypothetical protein
LSLSDLGIEVDPIWIIFFDQCNLPDPRPFLQSLFALKGRLDFVETFEIHQPIHVIILGEAFGSTRLMLVHATNEIVGYADVKRASDAACEYVDVIAARSHPASLEYWVARSSRAMTVSFVVLESANPAA